MPELPEVETVRNVLKSWILGKKIKEVHVIYPRIIDNVSVDLFKKTLKNQTFKDIERYGKYLVFVLDKNVIVSHLRMEGKYYYGHLKGSKVKSGYEYDFKTAKNDHDMKHVHIMFEFDDGSLLMYHDVRKFGRMELSTKKEYFKNTPLVKLGLDPFKMSGKQLYDILSNRATPIKLALLDQSIIAGIGNIYADEICFKSKLSPFTLASSLDLKKCNEIVKNTVSILKLAIKNGGSTIKSYHSSNGVDGKFQTHLNVYGREKEKCNVCGAPIVKTTLGQRGTHFCPSCQVKELPKKVKVIGITGLIGSGKSSVSSIFTKHGYEIIDADKLAKEALNKGTSCYNEVIKEFGKKILNKDKSINRSALRELVSNNKELIIKLEKIEHPYVINKTEELIANNPKKKYLLDVPLLFESNMNKLCDLVVFINIESKTRKNRLLVRDTMPLSDADSLNKRVIPASTKIMLSDYIIDNSLSLKETTKQVNSLLNRIK